MVTLKSHSCDASPSASALTFGLCHWCHVLWRQTCWCWSVQPLAPPCLRAPPPAAASIPRQPKSGCSGGSAYCGNSTGGWMSRSFCLRQSRKVFCHLSLCWLLATKICLSQVFAVHWRSQVMSCLFKLVCKHGDNMLYGWASCFLYLSVFCEACQDKSGLYAKVSEMLPVRVASYMLMPYTLPVQSAYSVAQRWGVGLIIDCISPLSKWVLHIKLFFPPIHLIARVTSMTRLIRHIMSYLLCLRFVEWIPEVPADVRWLFGVAGDVYRQAWKGEPAGSIRWAMTFHTVSFSNKALVIQSQSSIRYVQSLESE